MHRREGARDASCRIVCMYVLKRLYVCVIHRLAEAANETEERAQDASRRTSIVYVYTRMYADEPAEVADSGADSDFLTYVYDDVTYVYDDVT